MVYPFELTDLVLNFFLPFVRIAALLMVIPIFGTQLVPKRIKLLLSFAISLIVFTSSYQDVAHFNQQFSLFHLLLLVLQQILIGVVIGLSVHIVFQSFVVAGQICAMQMGLGFASMNDPQNGVSVPAVGQFYLMIVTLLYLSINGHLYTIQTLIESFKVFPLYDFNLLALPAKELISLSVWIFLGGVKIALPAITALLIVNLSIGVMTKAAPQLNIFSIGFPITMILGLIILWFSSLAILPEFSNLIATLHTSISSWGT